MKTIQLGAFFLLLMIGASNCAGIGKLCVSEPEMEIDEKQLAADIELIEQYFTEHAIDYAKIHESGIRYIINAPGSGKQPTLCDEVSVTYVGRLLATGEAFEASVNPIKLSLDKLITGWQIGIPLISLGGSITLFVPSGYAYGSEGAGRVPADAVLMFEISLKEIH